MVHATTVTRKLSIVFVRFRARFKRGKRFQILERRYDMYELSRQELCRYNEYGHRMRIEHAQKKHNENKNLIEYDAKKT
jgi:hypothetical protein